MFISIFAGEVCMSICIRCGAKTEESHKFCMSCGYPVQRPNRTTAPNSSANTTNTQTRTKEVHIPVCIRCGSKMEPFHSFCMSCGYPVQQKTQTTTQSGRNQTNSSSYQTSAETATFPVCKKCGERIEITDLFCISCGYPTQQKTKTSSSNNEASAYYSSQPISEREKCIVELNKMCEHFGKMQSVYNEYDNCYKVREEINQEIRKERKSDVNLGAVALTMCVLGTLIFIIGQFTWSLFSFKEAFWWLLAGICIAPGGVFLMIIYTKQRNAVLRELKKRNSQQASLATELTKHYANYGYCIVGPEYTNPKILARIRENLNSGRADNLDKAIKLLYHDARRKEFMVKIDLSSEIENNNAQGANTASAFIPASFFKL